MFSSSIIPCDDQHSYVVRSNEVILSHPQVVDRLQRTSADKRFVEQFKKLLTAATDGNLHDCKSVIEEGFDDFEAHGEGPYFMGSSKVTPLQIAEKNGHLKVVAYLRQAPYLKIDQLKLKYLDNDAQLSKESHELKPFEVLLGNLEKNVKILLNTCLDAVEEQSMSIGSLKLLCDYTYERVNRLFLNVIESKKVELIDKSALEKSLSDQSLARERVQLLMQRAKEIEADAMLVCFDYQEHAGKNSFLKALLTTHTSISKTLTETDKKVYGILSKRIEKLEQKQKDFDKLQESILQTINDARKELEKQNSNSSTSSRQSQRKKNASIEKSDELDDEKQKENAVAKKISYDLNEGIYRALHDINLDNDSLKRTMERIEERSKTHEITISGMRNLILSTRAIPDWALLRCLELLKFKGSDWACLESAIQIQRSEKVLLKVLELMEDPHEDYLDFAVDVSPHCQFVEKLINRGMRVDKNILARAFRREVPPKPVLPNETALLLLNHCNEALTDEQMIDSALKNDQSDEVIVALVNKFEEVNWTVMKLARTKQRSPAVLTAINAKLSFADKLELLCQIL